MQQSAVIMCICTNLLPSSIHNKMISLKCGKRKLLMNITASIYEEASTNIEEMYVHTDSHFLCNRSARIAFSNLDYSMGDLAESMKVGSV